MYLSYGDVLRRHENHSRLAQNAPLLHQAVRRATVVGEPSLATHGTWGRGRERGGARGGVEPGPILNGCRI